MEEGTMPRERRRSHRVYVPGARARCSWGRSLANFSVIDVSRSGALLEGDHVLDEGDRLEMWLHLPGQEPLYLDGTVIRSAQRMGVSLAGVVFRFLIEEDQDAVEEIVARMRSSRGAETIVVAIPHDAGRRMVRLLRGHHPTVIRATTPLDLIQCLHVAGERAASVLIGEHLGRLGAGDIARFVRDVCPDARRVLVQSTIRMDRDAIDELVQGTISLPWERETLLSVLGLEPTRIAD